MNYLELKQEVDRLKKQLMIGLQQEASSKEIKVTVVSDMPLQPWLELYLQMFWAQNGQIASIRRILWQQRHEVEVTRDEVLVFWPSTETSAEIEPKWEKAGIWIGPEKASDPLQLFYCQTQQESKRVEYPAGSIVIDPEKLMLRLGLAASLANKEGRWGDRYSAALQKEAAREIVRVYETQHSRRKKCLVLDCDGVLWGGIVSEDGLSDIALGETGKGKLYREFQILLNKLNEHGIILALCSKNDEADVDAVFDSHTAMILKKEAIAARSVSWKPKSQQLEDLSEMLQIDLQDMVLVDDSRWEIEEVRCSHPQVAGVVFEAEKGLRGICEELATLFLLQPEDQNKQNQLRIQTYADNAKRHTLRQEAGSYEAFLEKLQTRVQVQEAKESELQRISDLSRRANQCTNGRRYTTEELKQLRTDGYRLLSVYVSDIYRDLGLVGCLGMEPENGRLDLFCLSCRALGRRVEQQLFAAVPPQIHRVRWADTGKNEALKQLMLMEGRWQLEA